MKTETATIWGVVEVMGRGRFAGQISEHVIAGAGFVRVDVPALDNVDGFSKLLSPASIFAITPTNEVTAKMAARQFRSQPLVLYSASTSRLLRDEDGNYEEDC